MITRALDYICESLTTQLDLRTVIKSKFFNAIAFNFLWLSCVVGQNDTMWLTAPLLLVYVSFIIHAKLITLSRLLVPALIGITVDICLTSAGVFQFENSLFILPVWLMVLWLGFSATLSQSLSIFGKKTWVAALAGAVSFPLNYGVGEKLGAVAFPETYLTTMITIGLVWALLLPPCFSISEDNLQPRPGGKNVTA